MDGFSNLIEFSIALAGFTSIVVAFAHKDEKWNAFDKFRITNALMCSVGAAFLSALPYGFFYFGLDEISIWKMEALSVGAYLLFFIMSTLIRRKNTLSPEQQSQLPKKMVGLLIAMALVLTIIIFSSAFDLLSWPSKALSYFGIIYLCLLYTSDAADD